MTISSEDEVVMDRRAERDALGAQPRTLVIGARTQHDGDDEPGRNQVNDAEDMPAAADGLRQLGSVHKSGDRRFGMTGLLASV